MIRCVADKIDDFFADANHWLGWLVFSPLAVAIALNLHVPAILHLSEKAFLLMYVSGIIIIISCGICKMRVSKKIWFYLAALVPLTVNRAEMFALFYPVAVLMGTWAVNFFIFTKKLRQLEADNPDEDRCSIPELFVVFIIVSVLQTSGFFDEGRFVKSTLHLPQDHSGEMLFPCTLDTYSGMCHRIEWEKGIQSNQACGEAPSNTLYVEFQQGVAPIRTSSEGNSLGDTKWFWMDNESLRIANSYSHKGVK